MAVLELTYPPVFASPVLGIKGLRHYTQLPWVISSRAEVCSANIVNDESTLGPRAFSLGAGFLVAAILVRVGKA